MGKSTYNAFLARGLDSNLANSLISEGLKLSDLKKKKVSELIELGLSEKQANEIDRETRPPIPTETVIKLLIESKFCCSVCHNNKKSIIIHHLEEWNESKSHEEDNLIVLCLEHHDLAHTKKDLSINLNIDKLKKFKSDWIKQVKLQDTYTILGLIKPSIARWDYFNHKRIFELMIGSNIQFTKFKTYNRLKNKYIDEFGFLKSYEEWLDNYETKIHMYNLGDGLYISYYMTELFDSLLRTIPIMDLTPKFNKTILKSILKKGDFVALQAGFYVKNLKTIDEGLNQIRKVYYNKQNVKIEFIIDAFECTSTSAWGEHISGHKSLTPIGIVNSIVEDGNDLIITLSCLAIGAWFDEHEYKKSIRESLEVFAYEEEPNDEIDMQY